MALMTSPNDRRSPPGRLTPPVGINRRELAAWRRRRAVELRTAAWSVERIGRALGISGVGAWKAVRQGLAEVGQWETADLVRLRTAEVVRLDGLWAAHWPKRADPKHAQVLLRVHERRCALLGLDVPDQLVVQQHKVTEDVLKITLDFGESGPRHAPAAPAPAPPPLVIEAEVMPEDRFGTEETRALRTWPVTVQREDA
jgi:hypothetical protein